MYIDSTTNFKKSTCIYQYFAKELQKKNDINIYNDE